MLSTVSDFLEKYNIKNTAVLIGFSAGPDSCALARILNELKNKYNIDITLCYFNHGWRKEALSEETFTVEFAEKFNLKHIIKKAPDGILKNEETAREYRYNFLRNCAEKINSNIVFLAHNRNDNIETLLYRVIKGTSPKGLCSIPEVRDIFYRPLLKIEKKDILSYLNDIGQEYLLDSSNSDIKYKRNYIRKELIPVIEKLNPNYINAIDNLITTSQFTSHILSNSVDKAMNEIIIENGIDRNKYLNYNVSYRYEILNLYLGSKLKYRDFKTIKKLDDFIIENPHSRISLNKNEFLRTRKNKIFIENNTKGINNEPTKNIN